MVLPKTPPCAEQISTTQRVNRIKAPLSVPLRVDFAGGWLDAVSYTHLEELLELCGAIQRPLRFSLRYAGVRKTVSGFFRQAWQYYRKRH